MRKLLFALMIGFLFSVTNAWSLEGTGLEMRLARHNVDFSTGRTHKKQDVRKRLDSREYRPETTQQERQKMKELHQKYPYLTRRELRLVVRNPEKLKEFIHRHGRELKVGD